MNRPQFLLEQQKRLSSWMKRTADELLSGNIHAIDLNHFYT
jgi:hypothetical protein